MVAQVAAQATAQTNIEILLYHLEQRQTDKPHSNQNRSIWNYKTQKTHSKQPRFDQNRQMYSKEYKNFMLRQEQCSQVIRKDHVNSAVEGKTACSPSVSIRVEEELRIYKTEMGGKIFVSSGRA